VAAEPPRIRDERVEVEPSRRDEHRVVGGVPRREVVRHLAARERAHRLRCSEHAVRERMPRVEVLHHRLVSDPERLVGVHGDLLEDDALFLVEVLLAKRRTEDVREDLERGRQPLGQHVRVVRGQLVGRERVLARADVVELPVDVLGRPALAPLEHHVLEVVGHAHKFGRLVARARLHEESDRGGVGRRIDLRLDLEAVGKVRGAVLDGWSGCGHRAQV
jgi:hypothetical protein